MGKGFNNYMTKKFFHPSSKENIKRVWMAQQKTEFEKKKEEEMVAQYRKEQDTYENRALLGDEKAKLGLSFMYDAPPGLKKAEKESLIANSISKVSSGFMLVANAGRTFSRGVALIKIPNSEVKGYVPKTKEEGEPEYKFEWQRKFNAPREQYAKNDETIRDQPFGIEVRNVRCIKCRQWGHVNTDRICPLFGKDLAAEPEQPKTSASSLLESMREDGFTLKQSLLGKMANPRADNEQMLPSEDEDDPEVKFLKSLTAKQKKKLLKKLNRLQHGQTSGKVDKKKKKRRKKEKKHKSDRKKKDSESSDDESEDDGKKRSKKKKRKSSESSASDTGDERPRHRQEKQSSNHRKSSQNRESSSPERSYRNGNMDRHRGHNRDRDTDTVRHYVEDSREKADYSRGQNRDRARGSPPYDKNRGTREFGGRRRSRSQERFERDGDRRRQRNRSGSLERGRVSKSNKRSAIRESMSPEYRRNHRAVSDEYERSEKQKLKNRRENSSSEESDSSVERSSRGYNKRMESHDQRISKRDRRDRDRSRSIDRRRSRSVERKRSYDRSEMRKKERYEHSSKRDKRNRSDSEESSSD